MKGWGGTLVGKFSLGCREPRIKGPTTRCNQERRVQGHQELKRRGSKESAVRRVWEESVGRGVHLGDNIVASIEVKSKRGLEH